MKLLTPSGKRKAKVCFRNFVYIVASAHLQAENKVAADTLLSNDILHGAKRCAQVGVKKLCGQQTHGGGHQVVWQGHICDLEIEKKNFSFTFIIILVLYIKSLPLDIGNGLHTVVHFIHRRVSNGDEECQNKPLISPGQMISHQLKTHDSLVNHVSSGSNTNILQVTSLEFPTEL